MLVLIWKVSIDLESYRLLAVAYLLTGRNWKGLEHFTSRLMEICTVEIFLNMSKK